MKDCKSCDGLVPRFAMLVPHIQASISCNRLFAKKNWQTGIVRIDVNSGLAH